MTLALQSAGVTPKDLADAVRQAFSTNKELLTATRKEIKVVDGQPVEVEHPDNAARQRAVESIYDLAGARAPKQEGAKGGGPTIVLNMPGYYDPEFVRRDGPKVIDVETSEVDDTSVDGEGGEPAP